MKYLKELPAAGFAVIVIIGILFILAVILLMYVYTRYKFLSMRAGSDDEGSFISGLKKTFTEAYRKYGHDTNTPAVISDSIATKLSGLLLCERFLNNAVSLFVTLGLFGTFLGLSMSVSSLTELISYSNTSEWLSVLDSVGSGLMSSLSGMGVAFYTSLVGAGCSILLTILRTIFNPQTERERLETRLELWLDTEVAPTLETEAVQDEAALLKRMTDVIKEMTASFKATMDEASKSYVDSAKANVLAYARTAEVTKEAQNTFKASIDTFNAGVHDFSEVDYNLRGSVERMDLAVRDLAAALREVNRRMEGGK